MKWKRNSEWTVRAIRAAYKRECDEKGIPTTENDFGYRIASTLARLVQGPVVKSISFDPESRTIVVEKHSGELVRLPLARFIVAQRHDGESLSFEDSSEPDATNAPTDEVFESVGAFDVEMQTHLLKTAMWIPRCHREVILGDLLEDCRDLAALGCSKRRLRCHLWWQILIAGLQWSLDRFGALIGAIVSGIAARFRAS